MNLGLTGSSALVTGGARGIGRAICAGLLEEGVVTTIVDRDPDVLQATVDTFRGRFGVAAASGLCCDVIHESDTLAKLLAEQTQHLDHLVCNVGSGRSVPILQEDVAEFQRMLDLNLMAAVAPIRALLPLMQTGPESNKSITFTGSICGVEALGCPAAYSSAKAALVAYAKSIARPLARQGIRVNIVCPGNIMFPGSTWADKIAADPQAVAAMLDRDVPLRRFGTAEDVANTVVFLASKAAGFVSGAKWIVDGGQTRSF